ncbi:hypothetical protein TRV_04654 [Trichophyton verrucosum HKI 0517]|uniref:Uncharacterized protein n=1 Tax=Trichophyton verrucosum (strain HKI 0517) TaxID=663202 RepID=D4DC02_TRIVH|nr:uncharacterized protein TRV_04654 [Trichophyton verrucosum HKI 0517]EFE40604.1 hypothetical protein TRV_04654 [Trichophyton verrucosum HKI 0517]
MSSDSISTKRLKSAEESVGHPEEAFTYDEQHQHVPAKYMGTSRDRDDMCQLGKTQVLRVSLLCIHTLTVFSRNQN